MDIELRRAHVLRPRLPVFLGVGGGVIMRNCCQAFLQGARLEETAAISSETIYIHESKITFNKM